MTTVRPMHDRVLIRRDLAPSASNGGILLPDVAKENPLSGVVVAVGSGRIDDRGQRIAVDLRVGERVAWHTWAGVELEIDSVPHLIMRQDDVMGVEE